MPQQRPNLLLLLTDQQRADTLAPGSLCQAPNLSRLAARGTRFENCYAPNPICAPVRASLFTGLLPHNHGMVDNPHTVDSYRANLVDGLPFWTRQLQAAGYQNAYFGKWHVDRSLRLENFGFAEYDTEEGDYAGYRAYRKQLGLAEKSPAPRDTVQITQKGYKPFILSGVIDEEPEATLEHYIYSRGIQFIEQQAEQSNSRPWMLTLSTLAPHDPYLPPRRVFERYDPASIPQPASFNDDLRSRPEIYRRIQQTWQALNWEQFAQATACYYAFCSLIDDQVGRIISALARSGQAENTIVVYVSDHGDYLGAHRLFLKGVPAFDEAYRVPLLLAGPGIPQGQTIGQRVNHLDLAESILPLLGLPEYARKTENPARIGRSIVPLFTSDAEAQKNWSSQQFAECHGQRFFYTQRILWWENYKYVFNGFDQDEFYNLEKDPHELDNRAHDSVLQPVIEEMSDRMWQIMHKTNDHNMTNAQYAMFRFAPTGPEKTKPPFNVSTFERLNDIPGAQGEAVINGRLVLPDRILDGMAVVIEGQRISAIIPESQLPPQVNRVDAGGRWVTPGLIDLHTHGGLGHTFNEPDKLAYSTILQENARRGVTGLLATIATAPMPDLINVFSFIRQWMNKPQTGSQILGAYLESPYISPAQCGALDPNNLRLPDDGSAEKLLEFADILRIFMLAPEMPGAIDLISRIAHLGIIPAAGHSMAKESEVLAAMQAGLRHVTHLFSAMSTTVREGPWRKPGLLESAMVHEGLSVEMIADNRHLPQTLMRLAVKTVGLERLCVVSDATSGAGLPDGSRFSMGQMEYEVSEGVGMMFDRTAFAGSTTLLNQMIPVLTQVVGLSLHQAIRLASLNPAQILDIQDRKGSLESGKDADLAIFNHDFTAWKVMTGGKWI